MKGYEDFEMLKSFAFGIRNPKPSKSKANSLLNEGSVLIRFLFLLFRALFTLIFCILFRGSNNQIVDNPALGFGIRTM